MATDISTTTTTSSGTGTSSTTTGSTDPKQDKPGKGSHYHHDSGTAPITPGSLTSGQTGFIDMHFIPSKTNTASTGSSTTSTSGSSTTTDKTPPSWMSDVGHTNHDWTDPSSTGSSDQPTHDGFGGHWMESHTVNTGSVMPSSQS